MGKIIFALGLLFIIADSCTYDDIGTNSLNGTWTVLSFENLVTNVTEFKTQENSWNKDIKVTFDDSTNPKSLSGTNISNQIFGEFEYIGNGQFKVTKFGSTYVNQPRWADEFDRALINGILPYKIANGHLVIYYNNGSKSVTLIRG